MLIVYCVAVSEQYVVELSGLPYFRGNFVQPCSFLIFNFSENRVKFFLCERSLFKSICLLIILVIGSCVIFGGFPSRFSKCCFHSFILFCWFAAFSFALAVFFLLLTSFIVCQAILDCLSSTESLILSIWFWMYSVCSFIYMPANWYCAVFSFKAFVFVGFFDWHFVDNILKLAWAFLFICTQFIGYMHFYQTQIIVFTVNHLSVHIWIYIHIWL